MFPFSKLQIINLKKIVLIIINKHKPFALVKVTEPGTSSGVRSSNSKILIDAPTAYMRTEKFNQKLKTLAAEVWQYHAE